MEKTSAGWSISAKVGALVALLVAFGVLIGAGYQLLVNDVKALGIKTSTDAMMSAYKRELKNLVEAQAGQLAAALQGVDDPAEQKEIITRMLKDVRFAPDKSGYFFAYTPDGTVVTVPTNASLAGQNLSDRQDKKGNFFIKNLIAAAEKGGDFSEYYFPKTAGGPPLAKLAYSMYIPGTKYWLGTGVYTDNIDVEKARMLDRIDSATDSYLLKFYLFAVLAFLVVVSPLALLLVRSIVKPVRTLTDVVHEVSTGRLDVDIAGDFGGELRRLKEAVLEMMEKMQQRAQVAQAIADGDLSLTVPLDSEHDVLGKAMRTMSDRLNDVLGQIQIAGEQITSGATQVADSSQTLSQGATQQASAIEEISASMNQLAAQTRQNAENAGVAKKLGEEMQSAAGRGTNQMDSMVKAMHEINEAGQSISNIIKTIDEIAFQTNLLALNAAVEAARAGQHGKGFAVVAEEVRNLAARSAKAASETADLIESSVKKGETGVEIAHRTSEALGEIVGGITKANDLVGEIAAASNEQAEGISQINSGLQQIDSVTQQNTATAEESAAAAEELSSQTAHLQSMIKQFHLRLGAGGMRPTPAPKVAPRIAAAPKPAVKPAPKPAAKPLPAPKPKAPTASSWGGVPDQPADKPAAKPKVQIALDDDEFGKY